MRTLTTLDDKRLYHIPDVILKQNYDWPLYATPVADSAGQKFMLVWPAVPIETKEQGIYVSGRLEKIAVEHELGKWLIRERSLSEKAFKCNGCTPEFYVKWPGLDESKTINAPDVEPIEEDRSADDFVRFTANYMGTTDIANARLWWNAFCYNAVRWLLEKREPLPMGFTTLHALPYRANWKGIIHARWPNLASILKRPKEQRDAALDAIGLREVLVAADLIEMPNEDTFGWTIEAVTEKPFENTARKVEKEAYESCPSPIHYIYRFNNLVKSYDKDDKNIELLASYFEKAGRPLGGVDEALPVNQWKLAPRRSRGRVAPAPATIPETYFTTAEHTSDDAPISNGVVDVKAAEGLQDVPDADLSVQLLRPHVSDRVGRSKKAPWVPLPPEPSDEGSK